MPLDRAILEPADETCVAGDPAGAQVVEEQTDRDPARGRRLEGHEERFGHVVECGDVELDVHVDLRTVDGICHRPDGGGVVRQQLDVIAHRQRQ